MPGRKKARPATPPPAGPTLPATGALASGPPGATFPAPGQPGPSTLPAPANPGTTRDTPDHPPAQPGTVAIIPEVIMDGIFLLNCL